MPATTPPLACLKFGVQPSPRPHQAHHTATASPGPGLHEYRRSFDHPADPHVRVGGLLTEALADSALPCNTSRCAVRYVLPSPSPTSR